MHSWRISSHAYLWDTVFCNHGPISGRTLNEIPSKNRVERDDIKACSKSKKWQTTTSGRRVKEKKGKKGEKKENVGFESRGTEVLVHLAVLMDARFPIHLWLFVLAYYRVSKFKFFFVFEYRDKWNVFRKFKKKINPAFLTCIMEKRESKSVI